jgi:hypothetical protein
MTKFNQRKFKSKKDKDKARRGMFAGMNGKKKGRKLKRGNNRAVIRLMTEDGKSGQEFPLRTIPLKKQTARGKKQDLKYRSKHIRTSPEYDGFGDQPGTEYYYDSHRESMASFDLILEKQHQEKQELTKLRITKERLAEIKLKNRKITNPRLRDKKILIYEIEEVLTQLDKGKKYTKEEYNNLKKRMNHRNEWHLKLDNLKNYPFNKSDLVQVKLFSKHIEANKNNMEKLDYNKFHSALSHILKLNLI